MAGDSPVAAEVTDTEFLFWVRLLKGRAFVELFRGLLPCLLNVMFDGTVIEHSAIV